MRQWRPLKMQFLEVPKREMEDIREVTLKYSGQRISERLARNQHMAMGQKPVPPGEHPDPH